MEVDESDGEVDWRTLGNILTGEILGQVHCASYLDPKYGQKQKRLVPETGWEYVGMKHKIVILRKKVEGTSLDSFMGRGVVNFPVERVAQYVEDLEQAYNWERHLECIEHVKQMSEDRTDTIVYKRYQATACLGNVKADAVYYMRAHYHGEKFVLTGVTTSDTFYRPIPGVIRVKVLPGSGYVLEPYMSDPNRTLVTYVAALSIGGVPAVTINKVIKDLTLTIHYMDEYLRKIWESPTPASNSPTDHTDIMGDLESEFQDSHPGQPHDRNPSESEANKHLQSVEVHSHAESESESHAKRDQPSPTHDQIEHFAGLYRDGEVDWDTLGQETTRSILEVVESAEAVLADLRYRDEGKGSQHSNGWRFVYEKHGITVYTKKNENSSIDCFLGQGVVNAPIRTIGNFTADIESTYALNNTLVDAKCLKVLHKSEDCFDYIGYQYHEATKCLVHAKRDNLYFVRCIFTNGKYVQSAISVEHSDFPSPPGTTRILIHAGSGWVMEPYQGSDTQTLVTYVAHVDLIGLPSIIANRVLKWHPLAIHHVRLNLPPIQQQLEASASANTVQEAPKGTSGCEPPPKEEETVNHKPPERGWIISGWDRAKLSCLL